MLKTESNPDGLPMAAFDGIRGNMTKNRSVFYKNLAMAFYGFNRPNAQVEQGTIDEFWREAMAGSILGQYQCVKQFEVDYTADLKKIDVPTLILHGDDDQLVPVNVSAIINEIHARAAPFEFARCAVAPLEHIHADSTTNAARSADGPHGRQLGDSLCNLWLAKRYG
jgi:pimeloyl-ACP methyl ester carboxylesterase